MRHQITFSSYYTSPKSSRLVRYDVLKMNDERYDVMVFEPVQVGGSLTEFTIKLHSFSITRSNYDEKYSSSQHVIRDSMPPSFEGYIQERCELHRTTIG